jgi:hypothetical protein
LSKKNVLKNDTLNSVTLNIVHFLTTERERERREEEKRTRDFIFAQLKVVQSS